MQPSKKHLEDSQMSYAYHFRHAAGNGLRLFWYGLSSFVHALFPFLLKQHAARGIMRLYHDMGLYRHLRKAQDEIREEYRDVKNIT